MTDEFEKRASAAADKYSCEWETCSEYSDVDFIAGAKWARAEMQAEIERIKRELEQAKGENAECISRFLHEERMARRQGRIERLQNRALKAENERDELKLSAESERRNVSELLDRLRWVRDGIEHFNSDEDREQVEYLFKHIDETILAVVSAVSAPVLRE